MLLPITEDISDVTSAILHILVCLTHLWPNKRVRCFLYNRYVLSDYLNEAKASDLYSQHGAVIVRPNLSKIITIDVAYLPREGEIWVFWWVYTMIIPLLQPVQCRMKYHVIYDPVIAAPGCIGMAVHSRGHVKVWNAMHNKAIIFIWFTMYFTLDTYFDADV